MSLGIALCVAAAAAWLAMYGPGVFAQTNAPANLPAQAVFVDPASFAVLGENGPFRNSSFTELFNPTNTSPPFFQVFHPDFVTKVLGSSASIRVVASNPGFAFAHEAPIWLPATDEVFFASNDGGPLGFSDIDHNNQVSKIDLGEVARAADASKSKTSPLNVTVTPLALPSPVQMTNGGTGPFHGQLILVNSGRGQLPPNVVLVNPASPNNATVLLDNYFGRQFNSLNDVKIHRQSGTIFFTDVIYGFLNHFRGPPLMPSQVYHLDPTTRRVKVVADGFDKPNGVALSQDGKSAFIADTGSSGGFLGNNQTEPATIYAFDIDPTTFAFTHRRVFAYVDTGVADGVQLDTQGNVYAGTGDGVQVWDKAGTLLGKFFLGTTSANLIFAGKGRLVVLAETAVYLAEIAAGGFDLAFP
ncbi:D-lactonohydrolase-like protein [Phanerochaete sordida]|uniref:D-lactonohydrolase-like protein n=1 Tax=Phanerochaete sordida TaxID=48140 RepID=A0A9P3GC10_9APHY|nr:D-lactonohydrolase-like protein [Phanerochaete sordida]